MIIRTQHALQHARIFFSARCLFTLTEGSATQYKSNENLLPNEAGRFSYPFSVKRNYINKIAFPQNIVDIPSSKINLCITISAVISFCHNIIRIMAYFERGDEANKLIVCNICNVGCKESSLTVHKVKCSEKPCHKKRFDKGGDLQKCQYDSSHIIKGDNMSIHLEFCSSYQSKLVGEYQSDQRKAQTIPESYPPAKAEPASSDYDDSWSREANSKPFLSNLSRLKL